MHVRVEDDDDERIEWHRLGLQELRRRWLAGVVERRVEREVRPGDRL